MTNDTYTTYNVILYQTELGELDQGEVTNDEPLGIVEAVMAAVEVVNHYIVRGYRFDGITPITTVNARQRWTLCHEQYPSRKLVVEVTEAREVVQE